MIRRTCPLAGLHRMAWHWPFLSDAMCVRLRWCSSLPAATLVIAALGKRFCAAATGRCDRWVCGQVLLAALRVQQAAEGQQQAGYEATS